MCMTCTHVLHPECSGCHVLSVRRVSYKVLFDEMLHVMQPTWPRDKAYRNNINQGQKQDGTSTQEYLTRLKSHPRFFPMEPCGEDSRDLEVLRSCPADVEVVGDDPPSVWLFPLRPLGIVPTGRLIEVRHQIPAASQKVCGYIPVTQTDEKDSTCSEYRYL